MDTWQQYTLRANTEFKLACYGNAILMHNQALDHARHEYGLNQPACCEAALSKVLISNFHLADCYIALAEYQRAAECYFSALSFLISLQSLSCAGASEEGDERTHLEYALKQIRALWSELITQHVDELPHALLMKFHLSCKQVQAGLDATEILH